MRWPAIHFVVLGAGLFALRLVLLPQSVAPPPPPRQPIVITAAQVEQLLADFSQRTGLQPNADDEAALVDRLIEDELLYRRAVELGFDRNDRSVRYRLIQKVRFLNGDDGRDSDALYREALDLGLGRDDAVVHRLLSETMRLLLSAPVVPPSEAALRAYFARHPDQYAEPARVTLTHVFLSAQRGIATARRDAERLRQRLRAEGTSPAQAVGVGDAFALGHRFQANSQADLAKCFGAEFAAHAMVLTPGTWSVPVGSAYGVHLVWIEAVQPAQVPPFEVVRHRVAEACAEEQRNQRLRDALRELRQQYVVRVETRREAGGA